MHYVELDVNNLRRWLGGQIGRLGAPNGANAKNDNGYIVYFSDRRNNKNVGDAGGDRRIRLRRHRQSGNASRARPTGTLDTGEDVNGNGTLEHRAYGENGRGRADAAWPRRHVRCGRSDPLHGAHRRLRY